MPFSLSPVQAIKAEAMKEVAKVEEKLKALDLNHNGLSDVAEAEALLKEGFAELQVLEAEFTPAEIAAALNLLFPGKFDAARIAAAEASFNKVVGGLMLLGGIASEAPNVVK